MEGEEPAGLWLGGDACFEGEAYSLWSSIRAEEETSGKQEVCCERAG